MIMLAFLASTALLLQTGSPAQWSFSAAAVPGGLVRVELTATLEEGWHMYATQLPSDLGPLPTEVRFTASDQYTLEGPLEEPDPVEEYDPNFAVQVRHHSGQVVLRQRVRTTGPAVVSGEVEYMVCNDKTCLPPVVVPFNIAVPAVQAGN
ncbi:MAG: protein-disulfide reductase DsbD family protein [Flavobacteriales bacterium]|jgi:thiol:disulfide interchange protein DsbD|nr:protein-disulfide reductase DsbD family protein [Flavobacteriales bacterium]